MKQAIIQTKLNTPIPPPRTIQRSHLIQKLKTSVNAGKQITLISAPAGFGKTTCVLEWLNTIDTPFTWLSLDTQDNDPGCFFTYLIAALQKIEPDFGQEISAVINSGQIPPDESISTALINDMLRINCRFIVLLDDFHTIHDNNILNVMHQIISNQPHQLHLVIITREDPDFPLARLRANNKLTEIRAKDLRFSNHDIQQLFKEIVKIPLSNEDVSLLERKTEGWAAGLQLAGLSLKDASNPSDHISNLSGGHRFILSYLTEQVLEQQPESVRDFLIQTSILEAFNSDLCDAVTQRSDSRHLLEQLYKANMFLVPLDSHHRWFRYHHLFSDLLRELLNRTNTGEQRILHQRASQWLIRNDMISEAIQHLLSASDYAGCLSLLEEHAMSMVMHGYASTVHAWLDALPDEWRAKSVRTKIAFAWAYTLQGAYPQVIQSLDQIKDPPAADGDATSRAEWLVLNSLVEFMRGDLDKCMKIASEALSLCSGHNHHIQSLAYYCQASVLQARRDFQQATELFTKSIQASRQSGTLFSELMSTISLVEMAFQGGKLNQAEDLTSGAIRHLESSSELPPFGAYLYLAAADIHYQRHQLDETVHLTRYALHLSNLGGYNTGVIFCRLLLSRIFQLQNNLRDARHEVQQAQELLPPEGPQYIQQDVDAQKIRVLIDLQTPQAAVTMIEKHGFSFDKGFHFPDLREGAPLPTSLAVLYNRSLRLLLEGGYDSEILNSGLELSNRLITAAVENQQFLVEIEALLLRAQLHSVLGNTKAGNINVVSALERCQPEGLISIFIEQGEPIHKVLMNLLADDKAETVANRYIQSILDAFADTEMDNETEVILIGPLTDRERDVLLLMSKGHKYKEIGDILFISQNTVRYHVKAIYRKFNVNNRTQALEKARKLQII